MTLNPVFWKLTEETDMWNVYPVQDTKCKNRDEPTVGMVWYTLSVLLMLSGSD